MPLPVGTIASASVERLRLPVAGCEAVRATVAGGPQSAEVIGTPRGAVYLRCADGTVLALLAPGAARLPLGLVTGDETTLDRLAERADQPVQVGAGEIRLGTTTAAVVRWWSPRLIGLAARPATRIRAEVPPELVPVRNAVLDLAAAVVEHDHAGTTQAAGQLAGWGPGLTPAGDDVLLGLGSTLTCFEHPLAGLFAPLVDGRTTDLAAALIGHAANGEYVDEVAAVLAAAAGDGDLRRAVVRLRAVGQSSGPALLLGVAIGLAAR